jgi:hypothetical protein
MKGLILLNTAKFTFLHKSRQLAAFFYNRPSLTVIQDTKAN